MIATVSTALLLACAGSSPPPTQYLLRAETTGRTGRLESPVRIGLGRVAVAPYLEASTGIVVETEVGQVRAARQHQWAEPLAAGLRSVLRAEISHTLGFEVSVSRTGIVWDYTVDVYVDQLHGTMTGAAVLKASYRITPRSGAGEVVEFLFSGSAPLPREGYPGVVAAEVGLARDLAAAIAASLQRLDQP